MPGLFDDLVPQGQVPAAAPPSVAGGLFDDLLPQKEVAPITQTAMSGTAPIRSTASLFLEGLPKFPGAVIQSLGNLAKGAVTGDILPQSANMPGGEREGDIGAVLNAAALGTPLSVAGGVPKVLAPLKAPTEAALEASKTARYSDPAITNLRFEPVAGPDVANRIRTDLKAAKLDKFNGQPYYDIADRLEKPRFGDDLTMADFEAARQDAQTTASAPGNDRRGSAVVRNVIDNYLGNIPQSHVLSGDAAAANSALLKARQDFAALKRSQDITSALGRAENQAGATFSGHNLDNATRQQLKPILNQKEGVSKVKAFQDYTPEEIDALKQAVNGTVVGNIARGVGKRLGSGGGHGNTFTGLGIGVGAHELGLDPITSAVLGFGSAMGGRAVGALANRMTAARGDYLGDLLRSRSALANEMRANPQMIPAFWPQLLRVPPASFGSPAVPTLGINAQQL